MSRILTLRGVASSGAVEKIFSFESSAVDYGWKILDFRLMTNDTTSGGTPYTDYTAAAAIGTSSEQFTFNDWDESQMVGVVNISKENNTTQLLDYDHVIVSSLWLSNFYSKAVNYMIVLQQIKIDAKENIMYMLKERAQS